MRVLLSADLVGGVWDYSVTLAEGLIERGHEVLLAVLGAEQGLAGRKVPAGAEVECGDFRLEWMPGATPELRPAAEWLASVGRRWDADLLHLNQMAYPAFGLGMPTLVVAHSDVHSWFGETRGTDAGPEWDDYARHVRAGLHAASAVVTPSRYQESLLRRWYGRGADRVIHNGAPAPAPSGARRERLAVSAGRAWDAAKGMDILDAALLAMGEEAPPAHLFGATLGPAGERFTPRSLRCGGSVPAEVLGGWMERASVYVAASRYEPFGLAPLEAALRGCPLVLSDIGSFRELWDGCASFFRSGSSESLARALREALAEPERMAAHAAVARERARERYTVGRMVDRYLDLYRRLTEPAIAASASTKH